MSNQEKDKKNKINSVSADNNNSDQGFDESKNDISSEQLVLLLRAREGDEDAFSRLADEYRPMLAAAVFQYRSELCPQDIEELDQEALLAFHRAVLKYDVLRRGVKFGLFAKVCVNKAIISALRQISRRQRLEVLPIDAAEKLGGGAPADAVIEREKAAALRGLINDNLSEFESTVWWLYYAGNTVDDIALRVDKPKKSVENAISRVRRKMRTLLAGR